MKEPGTRGVGERTWNTCYCLALQTPSCVILAKSLDFGLSFLKCKMRKSPILDSNDYRKIQGLEIETKVYILNDVFPSINKL